MTKRRNAQAVAAWERKAGAHDTVKHFRAPKLEDMCPVCYEPFGEERVHNYIIGAVCSVDCLEAYWREGGKK
jgi:hypothetical protein